MQEQKAQGTAHRHAWRQAQSKHNRARSETNRVNLGHRRREERDVLSYLGIEGCFSRSGLLGEKASYEERMV